MTCPNFKVNFIKMHDTKFYCCKTMQDNMGGVPLAEYYYKQLEFIKHCPFCGTPMSRNYGS